MNKIRVAFCIAELLIGGAEKALTELTVRLDRTQFDPEVYVLRSKKFHAGKPSFLPVLEKNAVPLHFLNVSGPFSFLSAAGRLARKLRRQKADLFLSFMFHANLIGRFAARRAGIPVVLSGIRVSEKEHKLHVLLDRLTSNKVSNYLCVSRSVAEFTEKTGKIPASKILVIPNGVSPPALLNDENSHLLDGDTTRRILFAGRLVPQKGLAPVLRDADSWLGPAKDWSLWLVGDGSQREELTRIVRQLKPETGSRIHFAGWRPDMERLLNESDLFLLPSRYEGMPNVLLEAAAAGLPAFCSRCDGVEEILGENTASQTFTFGSQKEFLDGIRPLLTSDSLRRELGAKNRARALEHFSIEKIVKEHETLFHKLTAR